MEELKINKVIVFGGSGFIGSHVADELTNRGYNVLIFDSNQSPYIRDNKKMVIANILDLSKVKEAVKGCDYVYNFAAIAEISKASKKPLETIKINLLGHANVLEACRIYKPKRVVLASSLYVYNDQGSFYKASKQMAELLTEEYSKECGISYTILRFGSLYGPRSPEWNGIYSYLKKALEKKILEYPGDGEEEREYIHVYDAAKLSVDILRNKDFKNESVLISGSQTYKIKEIFIMISEILGGNIKIRFSKRYSKDHYKITPYTFKPKFAKKLLANPSVDLGQGLLEMVYDMERKLNKSIDKNDEIVSETVSIKNKKREIVD